MAQVQPPTAPACQAPAPGGHGVSPAPSQLPLTRARRPLPAVLPGIAVRAPPWAQSPPPGCRVGCRASAAVRCNRVK